MKIGIDLSRKSVDGVLIDDEQIINFIHRPIDLIERESKKRIMEVIYSVIDEIININVSGIGISLPSKIDSERGVVYNLPLIPHWKGLRIQLILQEKYQIPVFINNDMNCMALGEKFYGHSRNFSDILCISFGDTIGTSGIINNQLSIFSKDTFENINCLSQSYYSSIRNYSKSYLRAVEELIYYQKFFRNEINTPEHEILTNVSAVIGRLIIILLNNFNPQAIILDGYLAGSFKLILKNIQEYMSVFYNSRRDISNIIIPASRPEIKSLGASTLVNDYIRVRNIKFKMKTLV